MPSHSKIIPFPRPPVRLHLVPMHSLSLGDQPRFVSVLVDVAAAPTEIMGQHSGMVRGDGTRFAIGAWEDEGGALDH